MSAHTIDVDELGAIGVHGTARNFNNFLDESINGGPSNQSVGFVPGELKNAHQTQFPSPGKLLLPSI